MRPEHSIQEVIVSYSSPRKKLKHLDTYPKGNHSRLPHTTDSRMHTTNLLDR
jgi:hypothetical protein